MERDAEIPNVRFIVKGLGGEVLESEDGGLTVVARLPADAGGRLPGALAYLASTLPEGLSISSANRAIRHSGFVVVREALLKAKLSAPAEDAVAELTGERGDAFRLVFHPRAAAWLNTYSSRMNMKLGFGFGWASEDLIILESIDEPLRGQESSCLRWRVARTQAELAWSEEDETAISAALASREWYASIIIPLGEMEGVPAPGRLDVRARQHGGLTIGRTSFPLLWAPTR